MFDFSMMRFVGVVVGISFLFFAVREYQQYKPNRGNATLVGIIGFLVLSVGLFPSLINIPAELFSLEDIKGGRLITLLVIFSMFLFVVILWNRYKISYIRGRLNGLLKTYALDKFFRENERSNYSEEDDFVWVVIPALNEADNIPLVMDDMPADVHGHIVKTLIVNDGSSDDTGIVARNHGALVVDMPIPTGGGLALRTGYDAVLALGAKYIVTLDADGQNLPSEMADVVGPILNDECDVVIGSRLLGEHEHTSVARTVGVPFFNFVLTLILGKKVSDCASNYRAFSSKVLREVELIQEQYHTAEMVIEIAKRDYRLVERPISFLRRKAGETKKGGNVWYGLSFIRTILKTWLR